MDWLRPLKDYSAKMMTEPLIFERSVSGRRAFSLPPSDLKTPILSEVIPEEHLRLKPAALAEVSEIDVIRHYTRLSQQNFSVDTHFYPLGSCTMKYNPKLNERVASMPEFSALHPLQPPSDTQGILELLYELEKLLCAITGMAAFTLQPAAGAQGELTGLKIIAAYHRRKRRKRPLILIPDSAHGTNPASAALAGFRVEQLKSGPDGQIDVKALEQRLNRDVAALMLTNPNTLGLFERNIKTISALLHEQDALVYMDGANMNALLGIAKPADMGIDLLQLNLHKTFSTPHGGGGPGSGPVGVVSKLEEFLPLPRVRQRGKRWVWDDNGRSTIGRLHAFYGNVGVLVRAYAYIRTLGKEGLLQASRGAIINANYLKAKLRDLFSTPYSDQPCMHEFVVSLKNLKAHGVTAWDVAKRLLDYGFYAPTVYFPLIIEEAFMIEPTETESRETLDAFAKALRQIIQEAQQSPEILRNAPQNLQVGRVDEVKAAREPNLRWLPVSTPEEAKSLG
ncbi:MAG: aminomethyl-transferring glycine dehydrogenase subunit GcvPB [Candidatus Omnitrophica bacterium]|nr:aminomethyl-transferring glycine dehydrogenase subunit GcvPB [Candidatus Omnitrophota bacterium]